MYFRRNRSKSSENDHDLKKNVIFLFSTHVHPRRALFNFRCFSRMHYSEHRSPENECPNILVSTRFTFILSRDFVFFKNIKMCLMHGNVDKCFKNIAKLSKTKKKIQCFQTLAHVAPRRVFSCSRFMRNAFTRTRFE